MPSFYMLGQPLLDFQVLGEPVPQGQIRNLGKGRPSVYGNQKLLLPFRNQVQQAAEAAVHAEDIVDAAMFPLEGGVGVACHFTLRKAAHPDRGLRVFPAKKPDIDKLERTIFDALRPAGVYYDDKQVVFSHATKSYPGSNIFALHVPGIHVQVYQVELKDIELPMNRPIELVEERVAGIAA